MTIEDINVLYPRIYNPAIYNENSMHIAQWDYRGSTVHYFTDQNGKDYVLGMDD